LGTEVDDLAHAGVPRHQDEPRKIGVVHRQEARQRKIADRHRVGGKLRVQRPTDFGQDGLSRPSPYASTYSAMLVGAGTAKPSALRPSTWKRMASRISASTSGIVAPVATQPGRFGT